jgi:hypothetical protein
MNKLDNTNYFNREFVQKLIIILFTCVLILFSINFLKEKIKSKNEFLAVNLIKGFVDNPVVFWNAAHYYEKKKDFDKAVREINFGIGILINKSSAHEMLEPYLLKATYYCKQLDNTDNENCQLVFYYNNILKKHRNKPY